jgi:LEA14-like dessication related protein
LNKIGNPAFFLFSTYPLFCISMQSLKLFLIIFFPFITLAGCRTLKQPEFRQVKNLVLASLTISETVLAMDLVYFNPNRSGIKLKHAEADVYLNNVLLGHFKTDTLIRIPKAADFSIPVKLKADRQNILKNSLTLLTNPVVTIKVEGKARLGKGFFFINTPLRYEGVHSITDLIQ